jgi:hypothetical protein
MLPKRQFHLQPSLPACQQVPFSATSGRLPALRSTPGGQRGAPLSNEIRG